MFTAGEYLNHWWPLSLKAEQQSQPRIYQYKMRLHYCQKHNPYAILNVPKYVEIQIAEKAYKALSIKYHPDKNKDEDGEKQRDLNEAIDILRKSKVDYDKMLRYKIYLKEEKQRKEEEQQRQQRNQKMPGHHGRQNYSWQSYSSYNYGYQQRSEYAEQFYQRSQPNFSNLEHKFLAHTLEMQKFFMAHQQYLDEWIKLNLDFKSRHERQPSHPHSSSQQYDKANSQKQRHQHPDHTFAAPNNHSHRQHGEHQSSTNSKSQASGSSTVNKEQTSHANKKPQSKEETSNNSQKQPLIKTTANSNPESRNNAMPTQPNNDEEPIIISDEDDGIKRTHQENANDSDGDQQKETGRETDDDRGAEQRNNGDQNGQSSQGNVREKGSSDDIPTFGFDCKKNANYSATDADSEGASPMEQSKKRTKYEQNNEAPYRGKLNKNKGNGEKNAGPKSDMKTRSDCGQLKNEPFAITGHCFTSQDRQCLETLKLRIEYTKFNKKVEVEYYEVIRNPNARAMINDYIRAQVPFLVETQEEGTCQDAGTGKENQSDLRKMFHKLIDGIGQGTYNYGKQVSQAGFFPENVNFDSMWFNGSESQGYIDYLIHAINYAVGFAWFQGRDQVIRVLKAKMKYDAANMEKLQQKEGVRIKKMTNIVADVKHLYSLRVVHAWSKTEQQQRCTHFAEIIHGMKGKAFIVLTQQQENGKTFRHACTVKKTQERGLALLDSQYSKIRYERTENPVERWNLESFISKYSKIKICVLQQQIVRNSKHKTAWNYLKRLMTQEGEKTQQPKAQGKSKKPHGRTQYSGHADANGTQSQQEDAAESLLGKRTFGERIIRDENERASTGNSKRHCQCK